jgi:hypothetical protein
MARWGRLKIKDKVPQASTDLEASDSQENVKVQK